MRKEKKNILAILGILVFLVFMVFLAMVAPPEREQFEGYEIKTDFLEQEPEITPVETTKEKSESEMTIEEKFQKATQIKNEWLKWKEDILQNPEKNSDEPMLWQALSLYVEVVKERPEATRDYLEISKAILSLTQKEVEKIHYHYELSDFLGRFASYSEELLEKTNDKELSNVTKKVYKRILSEVKEGHKDFNPYLRYKNEDMDRRWKNKKEMSPDPFRCNNLGKHIEELYQISKALKQKKEISLWGRHLGDLCISQHTCDELDWSPNYEEGYQFYFESGHLTDARNTARDAGESDLGVFLDGEPNVWGFQGCGKYCTEPYQEKEIETASEWFQKAGWSEVAISARIKKILAVAASKAEKEENYKTALRLYSDKRLSDNSNSSRMRMLLGEGNNSKLEG